MTKNCGQTSTASQNQGNPHHKMSNKKKNERKNDGTINPFSYSQVAINSHPHDACRKFGGHVKDRQRNPPWMLKQLSDTEQVWLPVAHSSMSENKGETRRQG